MPPIEHQPSCACGDCIMAIVGTPTSSPPTRNRSSMKMISTPRSSPPSSNRSSWAMSTMHTPHSLPPILEVASDQTLDAGSDEAINKLRDLIEHQAGHTRSDTRDTIDSIVTGYASFLPSPPQHSRTQALAQTSEANMEKLPSTPKTPTRTLEHKRLSRSTGIADLRGEYEYSSSNPSSYVNYYEDSSWPGAEEQPSSTPPSSPPYMGDSSPAPSCPSANRNNNAEDEDTACSYELDILRRRSISSLLTPDCFSSAPPSECEEQESESRPKDFDGIGILLENLDRLQDELDDFIADYDNSLRTVKTSQYVTSQLPKSVAVQNSEQGGDEQAATDSAMALGIVASGAHKRDASKEQYDSQTDDKKPVRAGFEATGVERILESAEEHDLVELATQVAFGIMLGMVWLAGQTI